MPSHPKPEPRAEARARQRRDAKRARVEFRRQIIDRDGWRCRCCGRAVLDPAPDWRMQAHVHELRPRSLGGDPLDSRNCLTLAGACHPDFTEHRRIFVRYDGDRGADGRCLACDVAPVNDGPSPS